MEPKREVEADIICHLPKVICHVSHAHDQLLEQNAENSMLRTLNHKAWESAPHYNQKNWQHFNYGIQ